MILGNHTDGLNSIEQKAMNNGHRTRLIDKVICWVWYIMEKQIALQ